MISIIIVNFNVKDYLAHCVDSILKSSINMPIEIIIVDNNSKDEIDTLYETKNNVKTYILDKNYGYAYAVNYGIKKSLGDYILLLNPDTLIKEDTLKILLKSLSDDSNVGIVGCKVLNSDGTFQLSSRRSFPYFFASFSKLIGLDKVFPNNSFFGKYNYTYLDPNSMHDVDAVSGSCMLFKKDIIKEVGFLDDRYFLYFEDTDFCYRVKKYGYKILYNPKTQIIHYKGESVKRSTKKIKNEFYISMIKFFDKYKHEYMNWFILKNALRVGIILRKLYFIISENSSKIASLSFDAFTMVGVSFFSTYICKNYLYLNISYYQGAILTFLILVSWFFCSKLTSLYKVNYLSYTTSIINSIFSFFICTTISYFVLRDLDSRFILFFTFSFSIFITSFWRLFIYFLYRFFNINKEIFDRMVLKKSLIIGINDHSKKVADFVQNKSPFNYIFVGFVEDDNSPSSNIRGLKCLGKINHINQIIEDNKINEIIFCIKNMSIKQVIAIYEILDNKSIDFKIAPYGKGLILEEGKVDRIEMFNYTSMAIPYMNSLNLFVKRFFDILLSSFLLILTFPLFLYYLMFLKLGHKKIKMHNNKYLNIYIFKDQDNRYYHLTLLYYILIGKISFVGSEIFNYDSTSEYSFLKPGLTNIKNITNYRNNYDANLNYLHHYSFLLDIEILLKSYIVK